MDCLGENTLTAFLGGGLTGARFQAVEAHLEACQPCSRVLRGLAMSATRDEECAAPTPTRMLRPGDRVAHYVVEAVLGVGGMGIVYAASEPELGRRVALKIPAVNGRWNAPEFLDRFHREARSMARVTHHNVVTIYRFGALPDGPGVFIAMELISGPTLRTWLSTPRSADQVFSVFRQAAHGLAAAHAAGIVHRDFKPDNVLIAGEGRVCVSDFGIASLKALDAERGWALGSPGYMAPEQRQGERVDALSDVFSYCVSLHEALFRVRPSSADEVSQPAPPAIPKPILEAIRAGLSQDRRDRPALSELIQLLTPR